MTKSVALAAKRSTAAVGALVSKLQENAAKSNPSGGGAIFDSAAAVATVGELKSRAPTPGEELSPNVIAVLDEFDGEGKISQAIFNSAAKYQAAHGVGIPADLVEQGLHNVFSLTDAARSNAKYKGSLQLDSASSMQHDGLSLQPARAIVAFLGALADPIPFAHYLPADIGSNEARLAILSHMAGADTGGYQANGLLDGIHAGQRFLSARRTNISTPTAAGEVNGKITAIQSTPDACDQASPGVKTIRGRAQVYINGLMVGREANTGTSGSNPVNGRATIGGVAYNIGGNFNPETGEYALTTSPALPTTVPVLVSAPIDFERGQSSLQAVTSTGVEVFSLYAEPLRCTTHVTPDARTQMQNELGLDPFSESMLAFHRQWAIERHFDALDLMRRVSVNNPGTFNLEYAARKADMTRARMWADFLAVVDARSQQMAEDTMDHGITHLYVGKYLKAQWSSLGTDLFTPSGVTEKPGIFRFGRFGRYECYYNPHAPEDEAAGTAQVLCIGRGSSVARNPVVLGDAVSPFTKNLGVGVDLNDGSGLYGRAFTEINPHGLSALGAAVIDVTGMV